MLTGQNLTKVPNLTNLQKLSIDAQNDLIKEVFENQLKLKVKEISRDKEGHIYAFTISNNRVDAYVCAYDTLKRCITNYKVGSMDFKELDGHGYVEILRVHRAFFNKGLGTLMLQVFENYIFDRNKHSIELKSMKTFEDTSKNHFSVKLLEKNMNETFREAYIKKHFHDVNYYFYSTLGYVKVKNSFSYVKMKKDNLQKVCLKYGLERTKLKRKEEIMPSITESLTNRETCYQAAMFAQKQDYFQYDIYGTPSENIYPLTLKPIFEAFAKLYHIFKTSSITLTPEYEETLFTNPEINNSCYSRIANLDKLDNLVSDYSEANISISNLSEEEMAKLKNLYNHYVEAYKTTFSTTQLFDDKDISKKIRESSSTVEPVEKLF